MSRKEQDVLIPPPSLTSSFTWGMAVTYQGPLGCPIPFPQLQVLVCREHCNSQMQEFETAQA